MDFGKWGQLIDIFLAKNAEINLSAIRDAEGVYVKHILDSLELMKVIDFVPGSLVIDAGTGGGFPLLPLAIENPDVRFVGIDARRKKIDAIEDIKKSLAPQQVTGGKLRGQPRSEGRGKNLENVTLVWGRVEEYRGENGDVVMARAVAHVDVLIPWMIGLVKKGGKLVLYKEKKLQEASHAYRQAGSKFQDNEYIALQKLCQKYRLTIEKEHNYRLFDADPAARHSAQGTSCGAGIERVIYIISCKI